MYWCTCYGERRHSTVGITNYVTVYRLERQLQRKWQGLIHQTPTGESRTVCLSKVTAVFWFMALRYLVRGDKFRLILCPPFSGFTSAHNFEAVFSSETFVIVY